MNEASLLWVITCMIVGTILGSFIATLAERIRDSRPWIVGRSHCDACGRTLSGRDLVPLVSWAAAGGRCRVCRTPIPPVYPITEGLALIVPAAAWAVAGGVHDGLFFTAFAWLALALAVVDAAAMRAPFVLSGAIAALGLARAMTDGASAAVAAAATGAAAWIVLWAIGALYTLRRGRRGIGGGDPPAFGALAVWTGPLLTPWLIVAASVLGLVWAVQAARRQRVGIGGFAIPFASCLAAAAVVLVFLTQAWSRWGAR